MSDFRALGAILLAAGFSRRMGGGNKLLRPLGGRPLIAHALERLDGLGLGQLIVVVGDSADAIAPLLPASATLVRNGRAAEGMGRSLAAAAAALDPSLRGVFIALADMPFIEAGDFGKLAGALAAGGDGAICIPMHDGRRGHPVLFGRAHFPALAALSGDAGARALIAASDKVHEIAGCSDGVLIDADDPAAFAAAERHLESRQRQLK
ncbi:MULTISPECIES: nucleotidyltransferase family protein [Rhodomicrobium]|uniref:nucleotidyltransferase family protein n=1 Tax=Rhodomicrobium TaxID=1068 RepID=UPI000B4AA1C1|nr:MULTISPECIES: nucleotidyltransferase family protein [Rhodomicrobium]